MEKSIYHNSRNELYRRPFGAAACGSEISISIDAEGGVKSVRLMVWQGESLSPRYYEMKEDDPGCGRFSCTFTAPEEGALLWYSFEIKFAADGSEDPADGSEGPADGSEDPADGSGEYTVYYGNNHEASGGEGCIYEYSPECYQITVYKPSELPAWYADGIVYQIFPDRFARDDDWRERVEKANESVNSRRSDMKRVVEEDWNRPAYYVRDESGRVLEWPMYGGSLKGIESKLDYIKSLGATAIYLNPIFEASSNHRYDTGNYMHIDPALGTEEDFRSLAASAKERGISIILDGVFSHTGSDSIYFDIYGNYPREDGAKGAWQSEDSPYRSWFKFDESEDCGYKTWWGVLDLPEVNEENESFKNYILGEDGVVAHWMEQGASGWRLDVADELPDPFIAEIRNRVKSFDDSLLIGEVWEDASNKISYGERREYLLGDELDGTMNYPLRDILLDYVNYTISSGGAAQKLASLEENYPKEAFYGALNLIGSHDRERILTAMAAAEDYDSAARKVKLLATLQFALPGVPCIYYGDEAGLMGGADPENRSCFPWGSENLDLAYHYRMLGLIYDEHPALKGGSFEMVSGGGAGCCSSAGFVPENDDVFAFVRKGRDAAGNEETLLVLANRSYSDSQIDLSAAEGLRAGYALELQSSTELPLNEDGSLGVLRMERLSSMIISLRAEAPEKEEFERSAGVLCHISSLGEHVLGGPARDFVDYISEAGFKIWQVLPLNPAGTGGSPYSSFAAFAGDPRFINQDEIPDTDKFNDFVKSNSYWLYDYAAYIILTEANDKKPWYEWPDEDKFASSAEVFSRLTEEEHERANILAWEQYCFWSQWNDLKAYANSKGVSLMGDLPMYMAANSADVWANKDIFRMDDLGRQRVHAGVPPDAFSGEGQDWGNPLYDWDALKKNGYEWWLKRMRQCAERFDILRIDHFRGLSEYYAIPEGFGPKEGRWQHAPGIAFMTVMRRMLEYNGLELKLIAEDLGYLDAGVMNLLKLSGLPGMDIWQFSAWEMMAMPAEKSSRRVFYTGTHDNNTLVGFLEELRGSQSDDSLSDEEAARCKADLEHEAKDIIKKIYSSPAPLAMLQLQDVFMLDSGARMNVPGIAEGNWTWKAPGGSIKEAYPDAAARAAWFKSLAAETGR